MDSSDGRELTLSLEEFREVVIESKYAGRVWWLVDENQKATTYYPNCLTLFEQIGVTSDVFATVHKSRWRSKQIFGFQISDLSYGVKFLTVCPYGKENELFDISAVRDDDLASKENPKLDEIRQIVRDRVAARLRDTSDSDGDGEADTSFDTTTSGDTDTSMEEVDGSSGDGNASAAAAEKRKSTADQASADGTTANKVSRDATSQDIGSAKASSTTLSPELLALKDVLFDSQGNLKQDVATVIQSCIKDKEELAPQELRLAGCLFKKAIDGHAEESQVRVVNLPLCGR